MNRSRFVVLLLTLVALLVSGLTSVLAANVNPSFELTSVSAANSCVGGIAHFGYTLNHNGVGSVDGRIGRVGGNVTGSYGWYTFAGSPVGNGFTQTGYPEAYADNTILYLEVSTYSGDGSSGDRTFYSRIEFNCTTGEQVGRILNQAYPDGMPRPNLDIVDGPAFEHPLDIASVNPNIIIPELRPQNISRLNIGG
jgi:hypothetical protein